MIDIGESTPAAGSDPPAEDTPPEGDASAGPGIADSVHDLISCTSPLCPAIGVSVMEQVCIIGPEALDYWAHQH